MAVGREIEKWRDWNLGDADGWRDFWRDGGAGLPREGEIGLVELAEATATDWRLIARPAWSYCYRWARSSALWSYASEQLYTAFFPVGPVPDVDQGQPCHRHAEQCERSRLGNRGE